MESVNRQIQTKNILHRFYLDNLNSLSDCDKMKQRYYQICSDLETITPVERVVDIYTREKLTSLTNVLIVANHIQTPYLVMLEDQTLIEKLGVSHDNLYTKGFTPISFRHFPIVNTLNQYGFQTRFITGKRPAKLETITDAWGCIQIPGEGNHRTQFVIDTIQKTILPKQAFAMFPEGKDSYGFLHEYRYFLSPFKKGFAVIAKALNLPILPISMAFSTDDFQYHIKIHPVFDTDYTIATPVESIVEEVKKIVSEGITECIPHIEVNFLENEQILF